MTPDKVEAALGVLGSLLRYAEAQICQHDETRRGGAIWEICDQCGVAWSDDRGGKPAFAWPAEIVAGHEALATLTAALADAEAAAKDRDEQIKFVTDAAIEAQTALAESERDAARYRWLRDQHWSGSNLFVVSGSSSSVTLGAYCPSHELLDTAIDAMKDTDHAR